MSSMQPEQWPPELDALTAAPEHHKLLFENERVRVIGSNIPAGDMTAVHTHRFASLHIVVAWSNFVRYDAGGNVLLDSRGLGKSITPHATLWSEPLGPHALKNVGEHELHVISVEVK